MSSLRVDDRSSRSRSKSPGGRNRDRSSSHVRAPSSTRQPYTTIDAQPPTHGPTYDTRSPANTPGSYSTPSNMMSGAIPYDAAQDSSFTMGDYSDLPPDQRPGYVPPPAPGVPQFSHLHNSQQQWAYSQNAVAGGGQRAIQYTTATPQSAAGSSGGVQFASAPGNIKYTAKPVVPQQQQPKVKHTARPSVDLHQRQPSQQGYPPPPPMGSAYPGHPQQSPPPGAFPGSPPYGNIREVLPPSAGKMQPPPSPGHAHRNSLSAGHVVERAPSPGLGVPGMRDRMSRLSVSGDRPDMGGMKPPASPLLEAYHGTYQSISPMPSPMMYARHRDDDLDDIPSLDPRNSSSSFHGGHGRNYSNASRLSNRSDSPPRKSSKSKSSKSSKHSSKKSRSDDRYEKDSSKRARIYDATGDALDIVQAMSAREPNNAALIEILPSLSHDQMLELRAEYKRHCKVQGHGINVAKHIKMKTTGTFGKIAYVTALGRWESEGYWANTWYQSGNAKRELLIEALMGRSNYEIREIKETFRDKRYNDDLERCMEKELKADKFRTAVLLALEGKRQEESEQYPVDYRNRDVDDLHDALRGRGGGETAILRIVTHRSDAHLRDVLRTYEKKYGGNFARDALKKSNNLVGEVIAHILNGVINRPARDAMLLHHAIVDLSEPPPSSGQTTSTAKHERQQRYELLISRLVRLHWDRFHLAQVRDEYERKYHEAVEDDLEVAIRSDDVLDFCVGLLGGGD